MMVGFMPSQLVQLYQGNPGDGDDSVKENVERWGMLKLTRQQQW